MFGGYEAFENRQNALPVLINAVEVSLEGALEVFRPQPFIDHGPGYVDVFAERGQGVSAEEETVKERSFPVGGQRVEIFSRGHEAFVRAKTPL